MNSTIFNEIRQSLHVKHASLAFVIFLALLVVFPPSTAATPVSSLTLVASAEFLGIGVPISMPAPFVISGLQIADSKGRIFPIPNGVKLLRQGKINDERPVIAKPGDKLYVLPGPSPVGTSFQLNKCSGYFGQFQEFIPPLPRTCPIVSAETENVRCQTFVKSVPTCNIVTNGVRIAELSPTCQSLVREKMNYTSCIGTHGSDSDFYRPEWRLYPQPNIPAWDVNETYKLLDASGNVMGAFKTI